MSDFRAAIRTAGFGGKGGKVVPSQVIIGFVEPDGLAAAVAHGFTPIMPWTAIPRDVKPFANPGTAGVPGGAVPETPGACAAPTLVAPTVAHGFTPIMPWTPADVKQSPSDEEEEEEAEESPSDAADWELRDKSPGDGKGFDGKGRVAVLRGGRAGYEGKGKGKPNSKGRKGSDRCGLVPVLRGGRAVYERKGGKPNSKGRKGSDRICHVAVLRGGRPGYKGKGKSKPNTAAVATAVAATTATTDDDDDGLLMG